jgi:BarA-like signal transduction histidine kinase
MSQPSSSSYPLQPELSDVLLHLPETALLLAEQLEQAQTSEALQGLLQASLGSALMQPIDTETLLPAVEQMLEQLNLPSLEQSQKTP